MRADPLIQIHQMDCVEGMDTLLTPGSIDVVVTSPPYNLGIRYATHDDSAPRDEYLAWCDGWAQSVKRVLNAEGSFFLNVGGKPTDPYVPFDVLAVMRRHFVLQNVIHWVKSIAIMREDVGRYPGLETDLMVGHYKPINSPRFVNDCHEYPLSPDAHRRRAPRPPGDWRSIPGQVERWAVEGRRGGRPLPREYLVPALPHHPAPGPRPPPPRKLPPALPDRCLRLHGLSRVRQALDPFMGLGSTAVACAQLGIPCVGFELDPGYHADALERVTRALPE